MKKCKRNLTWGKLGCNDCKFIRSRKPDGLELEYFGASHDIFYCRCYEQFLGRFNMQVPSRGEMVVNKNDGRMCWHFESPRVPNKRV